MKADDFFPPFCNLFIYKDKNINFLQFGVRRKGEKFCHINFESVWVENLPNFRRNGSATNIFLGRIYLGAFAIVCLKSFRVVFKAKTNVQKY